MSARRRRLKEQGSKTELKDLRILLSRDERQRAHVGGVAETERLDVVAVGVVTQANLLVAVASRQRYPVGTQL